MIPNPGEPSGPRAPFGPRLAAFAIDYLIVLVPSNALLLIVDDTATLQIAAFVAWTIYNVALLGGRNGQTVGMRLLRIRAVDAGTGGRLDYGTAAIRFLMSIVSLFVIFVGFFWMLIDPERQTWQDKVAGTFVVPAT